MRTRVDGVRAYDFEWKEVKKHMHTLGNEYVYVGGGQAGREVMSCIKVKVNKIVMDVELEFT